MKIIKQYSKQQLYQLIYRISQQHGISIKIVQTRQQAQLLGWALNICVCSGNKIMISYFQQGLSLQYKLIGYFHQLSHCILSDKVPFAIQGYTLNHLSKMQYQLAITYNGIIYAKQKYGIVFSDDAIRWILKQNMTYIGNTGQYIKRIYDSDNKYKLQQQVIEI